MAAEVKEIIVNSDALNVERLRPDGCQYFFDRIAWRNVIILQFQPFDSRRRQSGAVNFAASRQRQLSDRLECRGQHIAWQSLSQILTQLAAGRLRPCLRHYISHQLLRAGLVLPGDGDSLSHGRVALQGAFDLAQFDAEAPDFYLMIAAPQELDQPICPVARQVARAVQPLARLKGVGVGYELLGRQPSRVEVAARQA